MRLYCAFELNGILEVVAVDELCKVRDGFWIDSAGNFTENQYDSAGKFCQGVSAEKFIMPHMIKEIRKEQEEKHEVVDAEFQEDSYSVPDGENFQRGDKS